MCGIVGYVGPREAIEYLVTGLRRLEYRGYDSSGVALVTPERHLAVCKSAGRIDRLEARLAGASTAGRTGIGHTRWATHGAPSDVNAHPHLGGDGEIAVVHNGVIENFQSLKRRLTNEGYYVPFGHRYRGHRPPDRQLPEAAAAGGRHGGRRLPAAGRRGARGLVATPGNLRPGDPLPRLARGAHRRPPGQPDRAGRRRRRALRGQRRLAAGRLHRQDRLPGRSRVGRAHGRFAAGHPPRPGPRRSTASTCLDFKAGDIDTGGYEHYMLKEIFEQPESIENAMRGRLTSTRRRRSSAA